MTTPRSPDDDERRLQALFDETASEPSQGDLDRLARAAAQIPARRRRRLAWLPALMVPLAAAAALALWLWSQNDGPVPAPRIADTTPAPDRTAPDDELADLDREEWLDDDDPLAALDRGDAFNRSDDLGALDAFFAPASDEELDIAIDALGALADEEVVP